MLSITVIPPRRPRRENQHVKTGCRTCKIRKIKCDEGKPSCRRCVSTGRVCDGYGVWGGGGKFCGENQGRSPSDPNLKDLTRCNSPSPGNISVLFISIKEEESLDWFRCRIVTKLPGSFISGFWTTLLLQASISEPAVMHAVLALSSVHQGGILEEDNQVNSDARIDALQQFALQNYIKAIKVLQTLSSTKEKTTVRTALIACIVFVSIDLLRGHFTTALIHLQNGLKLLGETEAVCYRSGKILLLRPGRESIDDWIGEAFCRLYIQVQLFKQPHQSSCLLLRTVDPILPGNHFNTFKEAWHLIEWLLNQTFYLNRLARDHQTNSADSPHVLAMLEHQKRVQAALDQWLITYKTSKTTLQAIEVPERKIPYALLHIYHTMADIMACVCLCPGDEEIFDSYTYKFVKIVGNLTDLFRGRVGTYREPEPSSHPFAMASSIIDMGSIPPLYYTALKCRVHRIRLQAVRALESTLHREGIWDAKIMAKVSRKVMELEERDFYKNIKTKDDFSLVEIPSEEDLCLPLLPHSYRMRDVEVELLGEPLDRVLLYCRKRKEGVDERVCVGEYSASSERWIDMD